MDKNYYPIDFNDGSFTVVNNGTAPTPVVFTFIPKVDFMMLMIEGLSEEPIRVFNIKANDTLVIDAENRLVTLNDQNYFDKYEAWEFPKLQPGVNEIKIANGTMASIAIEYTARYI